MNDKYLDKELDKKEKDLYERLEEAKKDMAFNSEDLDTKQKLANINDEIDEFEDENYMSFYPIYQELSETQQKISEMDNSKLNESEWVTKMKLHAIEGMKDYISKVKRDDAYVRNDEYEEIMAFIEDFTPKQKEKEGPTR